MWIAVECTHGIKGKYLLLQLSGPPEQPHTATYICTVGSRDQVARLLELLGADQLQVNVWTTLGCGEHGTDRPVFRIERDRLREALSGLVSAFRQVQCDWRLRDGWRVQDNSLGAIQDANRAALAALGEPTGEGDAVHTG